MKLKSIFLAGITALTAAATAITASAAKNIVTETVSQKMLASANGVNVTYRSQVDISSYIAEHPFSTTQTISYSTQPDMTSPYQNSGKLDSTTLNNGLNAMNVMRYIAGLPEVTSNGNYNALCQNGAYISALNHTISHSPSRPNGVSDSIFESGSTACGSSNLAMGYGNLAAAVLGYMDDSDSSNIDRLGHRRWILNPSMKQTGMGQVDRYSALYAFDNTFGETSLNGVCWPAQNMPSEYFDGWQAWSWSAGERISDPTAVKVTLKRKSDGKTWRFSNSSADGYFNVENSNYGAAGCVIFRPDDITINAGDSYTVNITGTGRTVSYTVNFFSLKLVVVPPKTVTGLKASKTTSNSVTLTWNKTSTADSYEVDMYKNGKWTYLTKITGNSYTIKGLSANTKYNFRVFSFKGSSYSKSAALTVTTRPKTTTGLKASKTTASSVTLSWNKTSTADSYGIYMYKNGKWTRLAKISDNSYTVSGLSASTKQSFKVYSYKGKIHSYPAMLNVTTRPKTVTGLKASKTTATGITLFWNKTSTADSYQVDIYKNGKWTYLSKITGNSYTVKGLSANTKYYFRVFSYKGKNYSYSARLNVTTRPQTVTGLKASKTTANSITLSWNKTSTADNYGIYIYKNGKWTGLAKTTGSSYMVSGLSASTRYSFKVFSYKGKIRSYSAMINATTRPKTVTGLKASKTTAGSISLSWNKTSTADSYQVDIYKNGKWVYVAKVTGGSCTVRGLSENTTYFFRVFSFKGSLYGSSARIQATTK